MILAAALVTVRLFWLHPPPVGRTSGPRATSRSRSRPCTSPEAVRISGTDLRADHPVSRQLKGTIQLEAAGAPQLTLDLHARDALECGRGGSDAASVAGEVSQAYARSRQ